MKRLLFCVAVLTVLACGAAYAQPPGNTFIRLGTVAPTVGTDSIEAGVIVSFPLEYGNRDTNSYNTSNAFIIFSDADGILDATYYTHRGDGTATWEHATANGGNVHGLTGLGLWVDTTGLYHKTDFPGLYKFTTFGSNGAGADTIQWSGAGGIDDNTGLPSAALHPKDSGVYITLKILTKVADTGKFVCIDSSAKYPPSGTWKWPAFNYPAFNTSPTWSGAKCFMIAVQHGTDVTPTGDGSLPTKFDLAQNYPNPFNPSTVIKFDLPKKSHVKLSVYNVLGQRVATLVDDQKPAGKYEARFDGSAVSSGMYFYKLEAEGFLSTKKMLLVK